MEPANDHCDHLENCAQCQSFLDQLSDNRDLKRWAPAPSSLAGPGPNEPVLAHVLEELRSTPMPGKSDSNGASEPGDTCLDFLAPPLKTGDLGSLGPYRVLSELGRGGMGIVLLAYDPNLERRVAIKVVPPNRADARARTRFVREAQAAAGIEHDHVVPVYSVANPADGPPYLVMQYVEGMTVRQRLQAEGRLSPHEAARVARQVAEGLAAAHDAGLIHRDIKPANIILDSAHGRAKIMDFGLVRSTYVPSATTQQGTVMGTPEYMSPEQIRDPDHIDARTDVHSLGVTLYEMLTGEVPFRGVAHMVHQQILNDEPRPPRRLNDKIPRDLETICLHCLQKEPRKRYKNAQALANDLRSFLEGKTIQARPTGVCVRGLKWARRRPAVAVLLALVVFVTALAFGLVTWQWQRAEAAGQALETKNYFRNIALAARELEANNTGRAEELLDECPTPLRGWEWYYLKRHHGQLPPLQHQSQVYAVTFSPDGQQIASGCNDGTVTIWEATTGRKVRSFGRKENPDIRSIAYSPDGQLLATCGLHRTTVFVWNATTGDLITSLPGHEDNAWQVVFSPSGKLLATSSGHKSGTVQLWDVETWRPLYSFKDDASRSMLMAFSPDGERLLAANLDGTVTVWDTSTGVKLSRYQRPIKLVRIPTFSPDCRRIAWGGNDGMVRLWDAETGQETLAVEGHTLWVIGLAFSPDGRRLVTTGHDKTVKVWDTTTGQEALTLHGHTSSAKTVAFSSDGWRLASASTDGTVRVWDATPVADQDPDPQTLTLRGHTHRVMGVAFSPDSRRLASASWDGTVKIWDAITGTETRTLRGHKAFVWGVAFSPDGRQLASSAWDGMVKVWDATSGQEVHTLGPAEGMYVRGVMFSPDGRYLASAHGDRTVKIWDPATGNQICARLAHTTHVISVAFSRDSRFLASAGSNDQTVKVWDTTTWNVIQTLSGNPGWGGSVVFSPDGYQLASANEDGTVNVWDTTTWNPPRSFTGHSDRVDSVAFSPDGRHLASGSADQTVRLWDAATGRQVWVLPRHAASVWSVAFSPDGRRLASASGYKGRGEIKIWDKSLWNKEPSRTPLCDEAERRRHGTVDAGVTVVPPFCERGRTRRCPQLMRLLWKRQ